MTIELTERARKLRSEGRNDEAHRLLMRAISIAPDDLTTMAVMRDSLIDRRNYEAALVFAKRIVEAVPGDGAQWERLACIYMSMDEYELAEPLIAKSLDLAPDNPVHWHEAALFAHRRNIHDLAIDLAKRGFELNPYGSALKHDYAHFLLAKGDDLPGAFKEYEERWETLVHLRPWDLHVPEWHGEPVVGRAILFHSEQGHGDAIMLSRFARTLIGRGAARVGLTIPTSLVALYRAQEWPGVEVVDIGTVEDDGWDYQTPMFSAMRWLGIERTDIDPAPYLRAPSIVTPPLPRGRRIGICWASGRWNLDTALRRHAPLEKIIDIATVPGVRLVSLQQGFGTPDIATVGAEAILFDPMPACKTFADTAAVVEQLDAVVTVDTAVVHLAAAMGKPTFMLNQFTRCWRWWELPSGRPWYATMTSARQEKPRDWSGPIAAAKAWVEAGCPIP